MAKERVSGAANGYAKMRKQLSISFNRLIPLKKNTREQGDDQVDPVPDTNEGLVVCLTWRGNLTYRKGLIMHNRERQPCIMLAACAE
jgi:hypothetical protein